MWIRKTTNQAFYNNLSHLCYLSIHLCYHSSKDKNFSYHPQNQNNLRPRKTDGFSFQCTICEQNFWVDSLELDQHNIGTRWTKIFRLKCPQCQQELDYPWDEGPCTDLLYTINDNRIILDEIGNKVTKDPIPPGEYFLQEYVVQNAQKLLKKTISKKARRFGPDFKTDDGVLVEVENNSSDYIKHGHHQDPKYKHVQYLIVENVGNLPPKLRKLLPPKIIAIDPIDLQNWKKKYEQSEIVKDKKNRNNLIALLDAIVGEFERRFQMNCDSRERDMSTCPYCNLCPYNSQEDFNDIVWKFLSYFKIKIDFPFNLRTITPQMIDEFCR